MKIARKRSIVPDRRETSRTARAAVFAAATAIIGVAVAVLLLSAGRVGPEGPSRAGAAASASDGLDVPTPATAFPSAAGDHGSPSATEAPQSSATSVATACCSDASPGAELARSDRFWEPLSPADAHWRFDYASLAEMATDVDLIVRGRISDVYISPFATEDHPRAFIWATVEIAETFKGTPISRADGTVAVALWLSDTWESVRDNVPEGEHVFFLKNEAAQLSRYGERDRDPDFSRHTYWRPNHQAVLRNIAGRVSIIAASDIETAYGPDDFPLQLDGEPFDDLVDRVRDLVASEDS